MDLTKKQVENYNTVWFEILKQKIQIIYEISKQKNVDFIQLLTEFVPEAFEHKSMWEDRYILKKKNNKTTKKKFIIKKKY